MKSMRAYQLLIAADEKTSVVKKKSVTKTNPAQYFADLSLFFDMCNISFDSDYDSLFYSPTSLIPQSC